MCNILKDFNMIIKIFITIILLFNVNISSSYILEKQEQNKKPTSYYLKQIEAVFNHIEAHYIQEPEKQVMIDEAIDGMLHSLDPYSSFIKDDELEFFFTQTEGEFGGIGVEIMFDNGAIKIITPIDDLPAYKAGIEAGDYIVGVNGKLVSNMGFNKSVQEMRGKAGTKLNLLIVKENNNTQEIELSREIVKIKPIKFEIEEDKFGGVGYIRIVAFNNQVSQDLRSAVHEMEKQLKKKDKKLKGIILDVRNNPGGLLDQAVSICEYFLDHGVIVSTKGSKKSDTIHAARYATKAPKIPIVVLINSGTASAAEIVAGALQDHNRAIIMGTTSFGKGLIQTLITINERSAIKLTTAKYYTPSGRSINAKGIVPDILITNAKVEYPKKEDKNTVFSASSIKSYLEKYNTNDQKDDIVQETVDTKEEDFMSKKYMEDYQYARAYDLIRGLIVNNAD